METTQKQLEPRSGNIVVRSANNDQSVPADAPILNHTSAGGTIGTLYEAGTAWPLNLPAIGFYVF